MTPSETRPLVPPRLVLGVVTLIVGVLFLADSAGVLRADSALAFWPVGLVALGLIVVLQPDPANRLVGAVLLVAGVWLLLNTVGVWSYPFWRLWPFLLIVAGAWMLYRVHRLRAWGRPGSGRAAAFAFLNSVSARVDGAAPFSAGEFSAVGGDCRVDLREATLDASGRVAVIDVFAVGGRIDVLVPADWQIDNRVLPLLGRAASIPPQLPAARRTVVVQGSTILGSVSVAS